MKRVNLRAVLAAAAVVGLAVPAFGQDSQPPDQDQPARQPRQPRQPRPKPAPASPATPAAPGSPAAPGQPGAKPAAQKPLKEPGPYIEKGKSKDWTLTVNVDVKSEQSSDWISPDGGKTKMPYIGVFDFSTLSMVFMLPPETGNGKPDDRSIKGKLRVDDQVVSEKPTLIERQVSGPLYHSGVRLIRLDTETPSRARQIEMEVEVKWRCWETEFDEARAREIPWPAGAWPEAAQATLGPQLFVTYERTRDKGGQPVTGEYDDALIKQLVGEWSQGNPKSATPVMLAKFFAGKVAGLVQPSGLGLKFLNTGQLQGFGLQGPVATLQRKRGTEFDMTVALAALYRAADLPARIVIGYEKEEAGDRDPGEFLREGGRSKDGLRSWVEFCLYDEAERTVNWVPVDVVALRKKTGGRAPDLNKPWPYFGTNEDLDTIIPLGLGFHPPTTVESYGAPALWGWLMTPYAPTTAYQAVRFRATTSSIRGDDKKDEKRQKKKDPY